MTRRGMIGLLAGLASGLALAGCGLFGGNSYRYKMTVEVETPQGLKTGFAVREITYTKGIRLPDASGVSAKQRGEAVAVDLPGDQTLFALLSMNGYQTLQAAFGDDSDETLNAAQKDGRTVELRPIPDRISEQSGYPVLVTFQDLADPQSVKRVDPENLAASFGEGVVLMQITVQMTDEEVSTGIEKRLGWLPNVYRILKGQDFRPEGIPVGNYRGLFTTELFQ